MQIRKRLKHLNISYKLLLLLLSFNRDPFYMKILYTKVGETFILSLSYKRIYEYHIPVYWNKCQTWKMVYFKVLWCLIIISSILLCYPIYEGQWGFTQQNHVSTEDARRKSMLYFVKVIKYQNVITVCKDDIAPVFFEIVFVK